MLYVLCTILYVLCTILYFIFRTFSNSWSLCRYESSSCNSLLCGLFEDTEESRIICIKFISSAWSISDSCMRSEMKSFFLSQLTAAPKISWSKMQIWGAAPLDMDSASGKLKFTICTFGWIFMVSTISSISLRDDQKRPVHWRQSR